MVAGETKRACRWALERHLLLAPAISADAWIGGARALLLALLGASLSPSILCFGESASTTANGEHRVATD